MRKPPQPWHGVARKGLSQRKQVPSALVWSRRVTRVSALPHRTQNASWVFMILVYIRFAASFPLLRSGGVARDRRTRDAGVAPSPGECSSPRGSWRTRASQGWRRNSPRSLPDSWSWSCSGSGGVAAWRQGGFLAGDVVGVAMPHTAASPAVQAPPPAPLAHRPSRLLLSGQAPLLLRFGASDLVTVEVLAVGVVERVGQRLLVRAPRRRHTAASAP